MPLPAEMIESLPEELRGSSAVQKYNDLPSVIKGYNEMESYRGRSVALPADDAKPEDIEKWKSEYMPKLGKVFGDRLPPDKPDDYEFKFEGVDSEALKNDKVLGVFRENAHKMGLSKTQAAGLVEVFAKDILPSLMPKAPEVDFVDKKEDVESMMKDIFKGETTQRLDEYRKGVSILSSSIPELKDALNEGVAPYGNKFVALGDHPAIVKLITEIGRVTGTDFSGTDSGKSQAALDAAAEIADIRTNKNNPKHELWKKGDKGVREYMDDLYKQTTGGR